MSAKQPLPGWVKLLFGITFTACFLGIVALIFKDYPMNVIDEQLTKIRENKITQAYYDYTSLEFQSNTSLDAFRKFVAEYPVLAANKTFVLESSNVKDNHATLFGSLVSDELYEMAAQYQLVKDDDKWKIQQIKLAEIPKPDQPTSNILKLTEDQLKALQNNEITEAYYGFVSTDFQSTTPFEDFEKFIKAHPIFTRFKSVEYDKSNIIADQATVDLVLHSSNGDFLLEYKLVRENGDWKIWNMQLTLSPEEAEKKASTNPKAMEPAIRKFLDALLTKDYKKAYYFTSREFQDTTPEDAFKVFIDRYPVFTNRDLADIKGGTIENGIGTVRVNLHDDSGMTGVQFLLGFESGEWVIWGMEIIEEPGTQRGIAEEPKFEAKKSGSLSKTLQTIVQKHLNDLRYQDISSAYDAMSERYQMNHSIADFENYLEKHPAFTTNRNAQFPRAAITKRSVSLFGKITSFESGIVPAKYDLIKENGKWKINSFTDQQKDEPIALNEIPQQDFSQLESSMALTDLIVGSVADDEGRIQNPTIRISRDAPFIYVNVNVKNGIPGVVLKAELIYVDKQASAPFVATSLEKGGDLVVAFSYATPKNGWPVGNYMIKVSAISGQESVQKFTVE